MKLHRGARLVAYPDAPARKRLYVEVIRMARDGTWADIRVCNCYVMWTKRQRLDGIGGLPGCEWRSWDQHDIDEQDRLWMLTPDEVDEAQ